MFGLNYETMSRISNSNNNLTAIFSCFLYSIHSTFQLFHVSTLQIHTNRARQCHKIRARQCKSENIRYRSQPSTDWITHHTTQWLCRGNKMGIVLPSNHIKTSKGRVFPSKTIYYLLNSSNMIYPNWKFRTLLTSDYSWKCCPE